MERYKRKKSVQCGYFALHRENWRTSNLLKNKYLVLPGLLELFMWLSLLGLSWASWYTWHYFFLVDYHFWKKGTLFHYGLAEGGSKKKDNSLLWTAEIRIISFIWAFQWEIYASLKIRILVFASKQTLSMNYSSAYTKKCNLQTKFWQRLFDFTSH